MDRLERIRRWQWILIAVAIGLAIGWARNAWITRAGAFGETLNSPWRFERGIDANVRNEPRFQIDSVVEFQMSADGGARQTFHAVRGTLEDWDSHVHARVARPMTFVAPVPYHPKRLDELNTRGSADAAQAIAEFSRKAQPTVVDYLQVLHRIQGLRFQNAWWDSHPYATWLIVSLLLVGGGAPSLINLALYGSIFRPREEKGASLWAVDSTTPAKPASAALTPVDLSALEAELDSDLDDDEPAKPIIVAEPAAPVRTLNSTPVEPAATVSDAESKAFGADKDDFYPTEQKARKHPAHPIEKH